MWCEIWVLGIFCRWISNSSRTICWKGCFFFTASPFSKISCLCKCRSVSEIYLAFFMSILHCLYHLLSFKCLWGSIVTTPFSFLVLVICASPFFLTSLVRGLAIVLIFLKETAFGFIVFYCLFHCDFLFLCLLWI